MKVTARAITAVFIGGVLGSAARLGLLALSNGLVGAELPSVTLLINILGSFVLGVLVGYRSSAMPDWVFQGLGIGFLGSFTTLSAISIGVGAAPSPEGLTIGIVFAMAHLVFGVVAAAIGLRAGQRMSETTA